ncbi:peptide ABC transporter ATPase [Thioalkalivibrio paradoxus ARh 1]|uniref:Peptide ABC transporter ATPase n=1 Tax=Thioalkalivibrio paradoxus ARh 1 TaxID=713585 RepID=W0DJB3_9GAMM|nr:peptide ABC transporter ATPase [Thioalkalivibrio paradoxus ARh 1]
MSVRELSVTYRAEDHRLTALERVDLDLQPGRIVALVGESGSGKSTLGKALLGLLPDSAAVSGQILLDAVDLSGFDERRWNALRWQKISMLFQDAAGSLNPVHRVRDQVAEPLRVHRGLGAAEAGARADAALAAVGLDPSLGRRYPHEISGGQLQRALLAMAMILEPEFVVLDEPTAALDSGTKGAIGRWIRQAADAGTGMLLITHDLELAVALADEVHVLYLGQVFETLPGPELLTRPRHPYSLALSRSVAGLETHRDLGGVRGDALYRVLHRHPTGNGAAEHAHLVGSALSHADCHLPARGCLFAPRCTQAVAECSVEEPELEESQGRRIRCLRGGIVTELRLQGVAKRYGEVHALHPTDLELRAGETFCLVGESGSGKTTLALMAAGMLGPDQGECLFRGRAMESWLRQDRTFLARQIGVVQQHPARAVSHRFTVFEIVAEPLRIQEPRLGREALRERVTGALRDVNLAREPEFLQRYPHELNLGALQRVCIARALITGPSLLIADEPTSALDPGVQAKVLKRLLELQIEKGLTLLMVTHDLGLARKVADRIGVMRAGRIVESGPAVRVLNRPEHPYTRALLQGPFRQQPATPAGGTSGDGTMANDPQREEPCSSIS